MLSNFDIEKICRKLDLPIIGVFSKDLLPKERKIGSYYVNLQNHDEGEGTHWVLAKIYSDDERENIEHIATNKKGKQVYRVGALYFDPFGLDMPKEVEEFLSPFKPIPYSNRQIQGLKQEECGWYCIGCDYSLEHKQDEDTYLDDYNKFITLWSDKPATNLRYLKALFKPL
jgi:hypothetical protein